MKQVLLISQAVLAVLLVLMVLIQTRGTGFSRGWVASGESFTRRGLEKFIFKATFVVALIFIIVSILQIIVV